jgi:mannose-6-phosphate isomerase-like protein (cupin superfamily)
MTELIREHRIARAADASEFYFEEGCYIVEYWNTADDEDLSVARARVPVGVTTRAHVLHGIVERYLIVDGVGEMEVGDAAPVALGPGDMVLIPAGVRQRIRNRGSEDLVFLAICTPRFTVAAYEDVEET